MGDKEDWGGGNVTAMISERLPFGSAKEIKGKSKEKKNTGKSKNIKGRSKGNQNIVCCPVTDRGHGATTA